MAEEFIVPMPQLPVEEVGVFSKLLKNFPAFHSRNFRLYFYGQLISLAGTWLQTVAQAWLVLILTHSALWVGTVTAIGYLPTFVFSLFGGILVDRFDRKKILLFTQSTAMILAFVLGGLVVAQRASLGIVIVLAALLGIVNAIDLPARQALVAEMVPKEHYASAFALNSALTNGARVVGPALAGILIGLISTGGTFIANGFTFIAVIIALFLIKTPLPAERKHPHPLKMIKEGLQYTFSHPALKIFMIAASITSIFGWSYTAILPIFADAVFHKGAAGLGYLYGAAGCGAVLAAILISSFPHRSKIFIVGGSFLLSFGLLSFSMSPVFIVGLFFLFCVGLGFTAEFSMINTVIQRVVADEMRGRVMSVLILMFLGTSPIGNFGAGFLAEFVGARWAIFIFSIAMILTSAWLWKSYKSIDSCYNIVKVAELIK